MSYMYCPECGSGNFWLRPDGAIICSVGDCSAVFGRWYQDTTGATS